MRRVQAIAKLTEWNRDIEVKITHLQRASKVYSLIKYLMKSGIASFTVILLLLGTFLSAESIGGSGNISLYIGLSISITAIQVMLAVSNVIDGVMNPGKKSSDCSICSKNYSELHREISCVIDDLKMPGEKYIAGLRTSYESDSNPDSNTLDMYNYLTLMYSAKEQLILNVEPLVLFSMAKKNICTRTVGDEIQYETDGLEFPV